MSDKHESESVAAVAGAVPCSAIRPPPRMIRKKISITYDATMGQFEALHKAGSEKFGAAWLDANMAITEYCQSRVDISEPAVKELLSLAALRVLMRLQLHGYLPHNKDPAMSRCENLDGQCAKSWCNCDEVRARREAHSSPSAGSAHWCERCRATSEHLAVAGHLTCGD